MDNGNPPAGGSDITLPSDPEVSTETPKDTDEPTPTSPEDPSELGPNFNGTCPNIFLKLYKAVQEKKSVVKSVTTKERRSSLRKLGLPPEPTELSAHSSDENRLAGQIKKFVQGKKTHKRTEYPYQLSDFIPGED